MKEEVLLTKFTRYAGCAAKLGPCALNETLSTLSYQRLPNVISDFSHSEDAGIFQINEDLALVQTVDFFPPIVDDPFSFGQIAAANSLSDVYAMGGKPLTALSIVCFPQGELEMSVLTTITNGALSKLKEAGCALLGGHSVDDKELKFGLAITGSIHPKKVMFNNSTLANQSIILTKALGTGIISTALRNKAASVQAVDEFVKSMTCLNKYASEIIRKYSVSSCTDVTGFGLIGHLSEMIAGSEVSCIVNFNSLKLLQGTNDYLRQGYIPGGTYRNKEYFGTYIENMDSLDEAIYAVLFDPQTSGGLLFAVPESESEAVLSELIDAEIPAFRVGSTFSNKQNRIHLDR